jgi:SAM-dependent methyltransferase
MFFSETTSQDEDRMGPDVNVNETDLVRERYRRREQTDAHLKYGALLHHSVCYRQEKERALVEVLRGMEEIAGSVANLKVLEIGCGAGQNLLDLIRLGFKPGNLVGVELLDDRAREARGVLPSSATVLTGDAASLAIEDESFDICYQSTVFTSLLDTDFQRSLAKVMWRCVKPTGGVLWYDFIYNNPRNSDVRAVPIARVKELFPYGAMNLHRVTLAPPIARPAARVSRHLYSALNALPFLRTHILAWISKSPTRTDGATDV